MEVLAGCIIANGYLGIPAASVQTSGDFVRAAGMFLFAPIGGWLTDRRFSNWTVQVAAMASWAVGCILLLASGLIASGGNDGAAAWVPPLNATDASSGVWGIPAAGTGPAALGWIGCILAALGSGVIAPLSTLLVADQIKRPEQRGLAIALYYCAFKVLRKSTHGRARRGKLKWRAAAEGGGAVLPTSGPSPRPLLGASAP